MSTELTADQIAELKAVERAAPSAELRAEVEQFRRHNFAMSE